MHHSLHPVASKRYSPHITRATRNVLKRFLDDPDPHKIMPHLRQYVCHLHGSHILYTVPSMAGATILSISYGIQIQHENDPYVETSEEAVNSVITAGVPGAFLVDSIPLLKHVPAWFPGASFQRKARRWHDLARRMLEMPYAEAKRNIVS